MKERTEGTYEVFADEQMERGKTWKCKGMKEKTEGRIDVRLDSEE
jgi:hypothetical protein